MKFLALFLQLAVMFGDLLIVIALLFLFRISFAVGLIALIFVHIVGKDTGGWFYAWRPANIKAFRAKFLS